MERWAPIFNDLTSAIGADRPRLNNAAPDQDARDLACPLRTAVQREPRLLEFLHFS